MAGREPSKGYGRLALLALGVVTGACGGTAYEPARSPRIARVSNALVRDGKRYEEGLGGGVVEAVAGNPRAEREAERGHNLVIGGFVCSFAGLVAEGTGVGLMISGLEKNDQGRLELDSRGTWGLGLTLGGVATALVGVVVMASGQAHQQDAINIYNDGVSGPPSPAPQP